MRTCPTCQRRYLDSQAACPLDQATLGAPDATEAPPALGTVLGSYQLISLLGTGGMGSIYIGAHLRLNRYVAIKLLRRELVRRKENITRFFEEARTLNRIKHPNIVESVDLVEDVVGGAYCVMELLNGPDLKARIAAGPLPLASAIDIAAQIADALFAAHELDIVHRDLKPENLILIRRGERAEFVKLIDFGVAQISAEDATAAPVGTPAYMAPEQAAGHRVDGRADIYALGVLLYEMTVGVHPFPSSNDAEYLLRHADDEPPPPSAQRAMPTELEDVILQCLAKQPADRPPTAAAVAAALRAIELDPVVSAPRGGPAKWIAAAVLALGAAAAAVVVPRYLDSSEAEATTATEHAAPRLPLTPPAPTPTEPVPGPTLITLALTSTPPGATVTRVGETAPLGVAPFVASLVRSDKASRLRFELAGHAPREIDVPLTSSHAVGITMQRLPAVVSKKRAAEPGKQKPESAKPTGVQREGVMDPFAN